MEPYLPRIRSDVRRVDDRLVISGIFHMLKAGAH
ncbi:MAG TPA: hypothetical protein DCF61_13430 [Alphaproteobacteria bacterium]|nr:hypothetical protein [Alphaproteobacteria bacterium]HCO89818.1 hypothetical protein [Alphaproteobacteria bacterium]